ncbi:putative S-transferase [Streptococcus pneumoniae]|nr:putative S-transferase [Streptococcus pneumoniae]
MSAYQLPTVWQDEASNQGAFTGLNRPTAGARFEQNLPKGEQALFTGNTKWCEGYYLIGRITRSWF